MIKESIKKNVRKYLRLPRNIKDRLRLRNKDFTLITSNCVGGIIYHELGLPFLSPTINLYMEASDFVRFCSDMNHYLNAPITQVHDKNTTYPVARIKDITIHCVHYSSFDCFVDIWNRRKERIREDNIFFMMTMRDGCTYEDIKKFDALPYKNKVVFVNRVMPEISSAYLIPGTILSTKDDYHSVDALTTFKGKFTGLRYIDDFDYVRFLNEGQWWKK